MCSPPPPGVGDLPYLKYVNGAPYVPKLYASIGKDISKCIEGGRSMKLTTLVDYIYGCSHECNSV